MKRWVSLIAFVAWIALIAGCSGGGARVDGDVTGDKEARAQALIESGNEAYREGDYRLSVRRYAAAAVVRKDDPAAYYGLGMALAKLGRDEEARQAYARARELARDQEEAEAQSQ